MIVIYVQMTKDYFNGFSNTNVFVFLYSVSIFVAINSNDGAMLGAQTKKRLGYLSNLTFGVYIVHPIYKTIVGEIFTYNQNPFLYILCSFVMVTVLTFVSCFIAAKIPGIKKMIRM